MTLLDWIAVVLVILLAFAGFFKGLVAGALSLAGVVGGAIAGARLAPLFLPHGSRSPYTPLIALGGAAFLAIFLEAVASVAGDAIRARIRFRPLRAVDSAGGLLLGAATGLALVWVLAAVALVVPGQTVLRQAVQRSLIVRRLNELVPPSGLLKALARVDPFPAITGPLLPAAPPSPAVLRTPGVRQAAPSAVRVLGTACGLGIEGSGWVAKPGLVVTAAHVVAGERSTTVQAPGDVAVPAQAVFFDPKNDVAVLEAPQLHARPLPLADPHPNAPVAILGYPEDGPLTATPGRIGRTAQVISQDAYGHGPVTREITSIRGTIRHGNSGGPAVDRNGAVESTIFAARIGAPGGYGIPATVVRADLARAGSPVSTGQCAP